MAIFTTGSPMFELELLFRVLLAAACGFAVGYERKSHYKPAGIKTHMIVGFAAALFMIISKYGFSDVEKYDAARVAAQVVSGISFLGAGIIIKRRENIEGLTTAATIWCMAGIGLAIGAGLYIAGLFACALLIVSTGFLHRYERRHKSSQGVYLIDVSSMDAARKILFSRDLKRQSYIIEKKSPSDFKVRLITNFPDEAERMRWEEKILDDPGVLSFEFLFNPD